MEIDQAIFSICLSFVIGWLLGIYYDALEPLSGIPMIVVSGIGIAMMFMIIYK